MTEYYDKKMECISLNKLREIQLQLINRQLKRASKSKAYNGKLPDKITNLQEIQNLPFTTKDDLRTDSPYGFLAVPFSKIIRTCATSGTTGSSLLFFYTKSDLKNFITNNARHYYRFGLKKGKSIQCMMNLNLSVMSLCNTACEKLGANFIPSGTGNTLKQIDILETLGTEFCFSTPNYLMHLCDFAKKGGKSLPLKTAFVGGEPCNTLVREKILNDYGIELFDNYGLTEMMGALAAECSCHSGLHIDEDFYYVEIVDPETGKVLPDGEYGELVVTPLHLEAMPLIRFRTRDITRILSGPCSCGRTHRRIEPITHRIDDMLLINGTNVFPSQIEECIYEKLSASTNYLIHIAEKDGIKKLIIEIELQQDLLNNNQSIEKIENDLAKTIQSRINVRPKLSFIACGYLPEIQGKAKRVVEDSVKI